MAPVVSTATKTLKYDWVSDKYLFVYISANRPPWSLGRLFRVLLLNINIIISSSSNSNSSSIFAVIYVMLTLPPYKLLQGDCKRKA